MSDPHFNSALIDPQYTPNMTAEKGMMAFLPNLYDPARPLPVSLTPEKLINIYELLYGVHDQPTTQEQEEDRALYGDSATNIHPEWQVNNLFTLPVNEILNYS